MKVDNLGETYNKCLANGKLREKNEVDIELIKSLKDVAEKGLEFIKDKEKNIKKESSDWTFVFRDYYESLRNLIEAILLFDKIEAENHQCKNAYLCSKHPDLDLNWNFLETIRLKRNAINYKGQLLNHKDWSKLKIEFDLHINLLVKTIEKKLNENKEQQSEPMLSDENTISLEEARKRHAKKWSKK